MSQLPQRELPVSTSQLPQLRMRRPNLASLPPVAIPSGYELRTYRPGDEAAWGRIMDAGIRLGSGEDWTVEQVRTKLVERPQFDPAGLLFVTRDGEPVASACAWTHEPGETRVGEVHMVGALPEHRGHRLGYWLVLAVLHRFAARGFAEAMLTTDDYRLAAIRTYLNLGFQPEHAHPEDARRWLLVLARIRDADPIVPASPTEPIPIAPIGIVRNDVPAPLHSGWEDVVSTIELDPSFADRLDGIEEYSHLQVLFWIHRVSAEQRQLRQIHPRDRADLPLLGTLATRTQYRPNPIGVTVVRLRGRQGSSLIVQGLDAIDGTPVLDVKPYASQAPDGEVRVPDWVRQVG